MSFVFLLGNMFSGVGHFLGMETLQMSKIQEPVILLFNHSVSHFKKVGGAKCQFQGQHME